HLLARSQSHAPAERLAAAPMGARLDASGLQDRRWLALVFDRRPPADLRRPQPIRGGRLGDPVSGAGGGAVPAAQKNHRQEAPLLDRAVQLGDAAAARPVLVPVRSFDERLCDCGPTESLLPSARAWTALLRAEHRALPDPA